jgi:pimeloyl-ACP methyl ester carboxylesterase
MNTIRYLPAESPGGLAALLALPPRPAAAPMPLLISVHGYTRQALEHVDVFAPLAAERGWALLAPVFDEQHHRRYQQLLHARRGTRSDLALIDLVERLARSEGLAEDGWLMFGYSAGAQFAHRFALRHPQRVGALALGAPGWYTWPDDSLPFPQGFGNGDIRLGPLDCERFLRLPMAVWVGERDCTQDEFLREDEDLNRRQGPHRLARAQAWVQAVSQARSRRGWPPLPPVQQVARAGHSLPACHRKGRLGDEVVQFFAHHAAAAPLRRAA